MTNRLARTFVFAAAGVALSVVAVHLHAQARAAGSTATVSQGDWQTYNRTFTGDRFSPLTEITADNVARLAPVCTFDTGEKVSFQAGPIVVGGIMYVTSDTTTYAVDAATCALKWKQQHPHGPTALTVNRGAAYDNGRLFRGAGGGHVIAMDAATGRTIWDVTLAPSTAGMTVPMAPVAWNGLVFVGNAGGDVFGVTGHVWALDQNDGKTVWRFDSVPESGPARATWRNAPGVPITGGAFWTSFAIDAQNNAIYVPAGNPAPDFVPDARPGENLFTNSVIALDTKTGAVLKYAQLVKNDFHDWDVSAGPVVLTTRGGRQLVASANKDGLLSAIDRAAVRSAGASGASLPGTMPVLYQTPTTTRENVEARLSTTAPVRFCPGTQGGTEWNGPAYDSKQNQLVVGATDWCSSVQQVATDKLAGRAGGFFSGATQGFGTLDPVAKWGGWLTAIDADTGAVRWKYKSSMPMLAGVTPTAGGVVFTGELNGDAIALDAITGSVLWRNATGNAIGGGVVTYRAAGKQRVAVAAGFKSAIWPAPGDSNKVVVYALP
jgi:alcohol dehydrogenase (cytochrome c)